MAMKEISIDDILGKNENLVRFESDARWFDENYKTLQQFYKGNLVLIAGKQVRAYAPTMELLTESASRKGIEIKNHLVEDVPEKECIKIFHLN